MHKEIEKIFLHEGYRSCRVQPEEVVLYYKYYKEGFHVIMAIDTRHGYVMTPEQHQTMEERVMDLFYHPQGRLEDFPEGFPVYHVEVLTLLVGTSTEQMRNLCVARKNVWGYFLSESRLLIYENQPGDFWGLRDVLETPAYRNDNKKSIKIPLCYRIKDIKNIKKMPYITIIMTLANIIAYIVLEMIGDTQNASFIAYHGGMYPEFILDYGQWWRVFTACFIHFGAAHLVNNMVIFCCVGSRLEGAVGHIKLLVIYLLSGIGGGLLSFCMMVVTGDYAVSAGASGAVFGTIGGLLWAVILHKGHFVGLTTRGLVLMIALSLYYGFSTIGVDNWGHIGGIVTGFVVTAILYHRKCQKC